VATQGLFGDGWQEKFAHGFMVLLGIAFHQGVRHDS